VTVDPSLNFDYTLSNSGNSNVTKTSGNAFAQNTITRTRISGTSRPVSLSVSGLPSGVSVSGISNQSCTPSPSCSSVVTLTVPAATPAGTYPITVTGSTTSGIPANKQTTFNLVVSGNPMTVSCLASPQIALIGETVTWTATVSGGTPPFSYLWSGSNIAVDPPAITNPFNIVYSTVGQKSATVRVTDSDNLQVNCPFSTVEVNFDPKFEEF
jgi:hypothetical protein